MPHAPSAPASGVEAAGVRRAEPAEATLAAVADRYLREHVAVRCRRSTAAQYRSAIGNHILPVLGDLPVSSVEPAHVADLQLRLGDRPAAANLAVATLSRLMEQAADWGLIPDGRNPCRHARKYRVRRRERFLTDVEFRRLGRALDTLESDGAVSRHAAAAIRLLMLTGCRRNEILTLRWEDVDPKAGEVRLRDTKTGPRTVPLSPAAAGVLAGLPRVGGNPWVIPGGRPGAHLSGLFQPWCRVRTRAGLGDVRLHDLRHSFASRALALGESLPMIARLLGHARIQTTARYAHLARDAIREAAARVAEEIGDDILPARMPVRDLPPPEPGAGESEAASLKESAARIAARIGEDILPSRVAGTCDFRPQ